MLQGNHKLTKFYIGIPTFDSLLALVDYLKLKTKEMIGWNGSKTNAKGSYYESQCFTEMTLVTTCLLYLYD